MINYIKALVDNKLGEKGALFVEYALILAFVIVVGVVFLSDSGLSSNVSTIFSKTGSELSKAAN